MAYPRMPDRCDYAAVHERFSNMFRKGRRCVISLDLDGVFSAALLSHVLEWEVAGFYTLNDLWVRRDILPAAADDPEAVLERAGLAFVDHDIYRPWADSIGHHMLQWSGDTPIPLHTDGLASLNPNLLRAITKKESRRKYPYGTFHFLLACASAWGLLADFQPDDQITSLLLHIDSSFVNAMKYQENALDWLNWLGGSEDQSPLNPICRRMLRFTPRTILEQSRALAQQFSKFGIRPRSQASVEDPTEAKQMQQLRSLVAWFEAETGWRGCFPDIVPGNLMRYPMDRRSGKPNKGPFTRVIEAQPFSYAIIGSDDKGLNYNWFAGRTPPSFCL